MDADFSAAVKARKGKVRPAKRRRVRPAPQARPKGIQLAYFGALLKKVVRPAHELVLHRMVPELAGLVGARGDTREDAAAKPKVDKLVDSISRSFFGNLDDMDELARKYATATSDLQRTELARQLKAAASVEVPIRDKKLGPAIDDFTKTNVELITTISERYFEQVKDVVLKGIDAGSRWEDIADRLEERFEVSQNVARVIAHDQTLKLYAGLNELRQRNVGITHFYWETAKDEKVCEICQPLDGKRFAWDNPPEEGLPGEAHVGCGCSSSPDTDELVDDLEGDDTEAPDEEAAPVDEEPTDEPAAEGDDETFDHADEWNEEDHPRDESGRFGEGTAAEAKPATGSKERFAAMLAKTIANKAQIKALTESDRKSFTFTREGKGSVFVGRDPSKPGRWRMSFFDQSGEPSGHTESATKEGALKDALDFGADIHHPS